MQSEIARTHAMIVTPSADLELAVRAIAFAAVGTAGQRCTTLRRLIVPEDVYDELIGRLEKAYATVPVGDPREDGTLPGPLVSRDSYERLQGSLEQARSDGGEVFGGEKETGRGRESGSDAWKAYMRRQTVTINYSTELPLAQGVRFDVG